mmetsp:Transcript_28930/g.85538  ORF Transcript_28930/g.85538 Transcript_28930/m.85538 type:complete len:148 (-) Transcript_28930:1909-2352(-)
MGGGLASGVDDGGRLIASVTDSWRRRRPIGCRITGDPVIIIPAWWNWWEFRYRALLSSRFMVGNLFLRRAVTTGDVLWLRSNLPNHLSKEEVGGKPTEEESTGERTCGCLLGGNVLVGADADVRTQRTRRRRDQISPRGGTASRMQA